MKLAYDLTALPDLRIALGCVCVVGIVDPDGDDAADRLSMTEEEMIEGFAVAALRALREHIVVG